MLGTALGRLNALVVSLAGCVVAVGVLWGLSVKCSVDGDASSGGAALQLWLAFVVLYSVAAGGYYALFPAAIADVFGIRSYAAVNGFIYFVRGCGTMVGSPSEACCWVRVAGDMAMLWLGMGPCCWALPSACSVSDGLTLCGEGGRGGLS